MKFLLLQIKSASHFGAGPLGFIRDALKISEHRLVTHEGDMLREIGNTGTRMDRNGAAIGFFMSGEHLHQGRLAGAIAANQADFEPFMNGKRPFVKEHAGANRFG